VWATAEGSLVLKGRLRRDNSSIFQPTISGHDWSVLRRDGQIPFTALDSGRRSMSFDFESHICHTNTEVWARLAPIAQLKALKLLQTKPAELTNSVPGHHHSKELGPFPPLSPAQGSAQDMSLERLREQVGLISKQKCHELTLSFEPRFLVGLRIQLHGRSDIFVTQNALYRFRITLQLHQRGSQRMPEVVEAEPNLLVLFDDFHFMMLLARFE
jgi:hypothetical protein